MAYVKETRKGNLKCKKKYPIKEKKKRKLSQVVVHLCNTRWRLRQEDCEFLD